MKILRNIALSLALLFLSGWFPHGYVQTVTTERLKIGDGGWAVGMDIANDGSRIMRTDIGQGYVWPVGATAWKPCITASSMAGTIFAPGGATGLLGNGPWEMVFAPSDSQRIYMLYGEYRNSVVLHLFRSTDQCASWQELTNFPANSSADAGGSTNRVSGQKIVVDPNNENVIYVSNSVDGVYRSTNAGAAAGSVAFTKISPFVPSGQEVGDAGMAIDGNSGTTTLGGATVSKNVYIPSYGKGIYASTDGGNSYSAISGGAPTKTITFSTTATNTCILVTVDIFNSTAPSTISTISDTSGLTWTRRTQLAGSGTHDIEVWYAVSGAVQTNDQITLTYTNFTTGIDQSVITVLAVEGCNTSSPFDAHAGLPAKSASAAPTISTSNANDLIFVFDVSNSATPDAGYTCLGTCGTSNTYIEYKIVSATQTSINPGSVGASLQRGWTTDALQQAGGGTLLVETSGVVQSGGVDPPLTPYQVLHGKIGCDGIYYVTDSDAHGWKWDGASWTQLLPILGGSAGQYLVNIMPAPSPHCSRISVAAYTFTQHNMSEDDGATWIGYKNDLSGGSGVTVSSATVPWYVGDGPHSLQSGDGKYNPTTGYLEISTGFCYYYADMPASTAGFVRYAMCNGAESQVPYLITSVPGGHTFFQGLDIGMWADLSTSTYPTQGLPLLDYIGGLCAAWSMDYAGQSPSNMAVMCNEALGIENSSYSTSGGATQSDWHLFGGSTNPYQTQASAIAAGYTPPLPVSGQTGGSIAMNATDPTNIIWAQLNTDGRLYVTTDGMSAPITWSLIPQSSFSGAPSSAPYGWSIGASGYNRIAVISDKVDADTFYAYNSVTPGLYKTTNKGSTWSLIYSGTLTGETGYLQLWAVPGFSGYLYVISGYDGNSATAGSYMKYSTDHGASWTACPNVLNVRSMGFGKAPPASGTGHPTIVINGWVGGVQGLYESEDDCQTWRPLGSGQPANDTWNQTAQIVGGDINNYGVFYTGQAWGSGFTKITLH